MRDQHLYKSLLILLLPYWECLIVDFLQSGVENAGKGGQELNKTILDLSSQPGAYDLSATATLPVLWPWISSAQLAKRHAFYIYHFSEPEALNEMKWTIKNLSKSSFSFPAS